MTEFLEAKYEPLPPLSPYVRKDQYASPKEEHKLFVEELRKRVDTRLSLKIVDVGCANGRLLHLLKRQFPHWDLTGYDFTKEFIETGENYEGLSGVRLVHLDMFDIDETFDIVLSDGMLQIFPDIERPLNKLMSICRAGGFLLLTGLFNAFDIEVRIQYCDNTNEISKGIWRCDWNRHSRQSIRKLVEHRVESMEFLNVIMDKDLPLDANMPINCFTFRDANDKNLITNGMEMILNKTMLVVKKGEATE